MSPEGAFAKQFLRKKGYSPGIEISHEATKKPRLVGINHVAIEVGNIDEALAWYGEIFDFTLRGKGERNAFIDMGDQFVNMTLVADHAVTGVERRHIGFVVDDRSRIVELAQRAGACM